MAGTLIPLQASTATAIPAQTQTAEEDSWVIVDLPTDATQLEYGAEVYRLVCKACHGDKGQGLTDDWRAQWDPRDQNCWQSKCHARNHPPDGFYLPMSPAVVGPPLLMFDTALDLYNYINIYMPWHDRGSMTAKDNWSVAAYILKINNIDPGSVLNPETAAQIRLRQKTSFTPPAPMPASPAPELGALPLPTADAPEEDVEGASRFWTIALVVTALLLVLLGIFLVNRRPAR